MGRSACPLSNDSCQHDILTTSTQGQKPDLVSKVAVSLSGQMSLREPAQSKTNTDTVQRNPEGITSTCSLSSGIQNDRLPHLRNSCFLHVSKGTSVKRGQIPISSFHFAEGGSTFSVLSSQVLAPAGQTSLCFSPGKDAEMHTSPCGHSAAAWEWEIMPRLGPPLSRQQPQGGVAGPC